MGFLSKLFGLHHGRGSSGYGHHGFERGYAAPPMNRVGCPTCGGPNDAGARFCQQCGKSMLPEPRACQQCGHPQQPGSKFCTQCGQAT